MLEFVFFWCYVNVAIITEAAMIEILKRLILEFQARNLDYISRRNLTFPILDGKATVITGMRRTGKSSFCN